MTDPTLHRSPTQDIKDIRDIKETKDIKASDQEHPNHDTYTKISLPDLTPAHLNTNIETFGWVESVRTVGRAGTFIELYFGYKRIKIVVPPEVVPSLVDCVNTVEEKLNYERASKEIKEIKEKELKELKEKELKSGKKDSKKDVKKGDENKETDSKITADETKPEEAKAEKVFESKNITPHTSLTIRGTVKPNFTKKDSHEFEIHVTSINIYALAPSFPINDSSSAFTLLNLAHLNLRRPDRILFVQARSELLRLLREFYYKFKYTEVTPPTLVQTQVEGGATLFHLNYYGEDAYLTQSSQLYLETVVPVANRCYTIMPSYRAERFNTSRHLSEYTHVEAEIGNISFGELMDEVEQLVRYVVIEFYKAMGETIKLHNKEWENVKISDAKFRRIRYADAIKILQKNNICKDKEKEEQYVYGDDISDRDEIALVEILGSQPLFLTNFPVEHKPFYCRRAEDDHVSGEGIENSMASLTIDKTSVDKLSTESCDLLWPGIGEILGGSMRAERHSDLIEGFRREGIDPSKYYWYTDLRLFGASRHGGYGLGFERFMRAVMKYESVNKSCLYPRFPGRCEP